jgi:hypothetical protein
MGIEPRLNLVFEFDGVLPNPFDSERRFSLPVMHVYIRTPGYTPQPVESDKTADVDLDGGSWDYQVIVDGFHSSARVYDRRGSLVGKGLDLFVKNLNEVRVFEADKVSAGLDNGRESPPGLAADRPVEEFTRITAALPMELVGDPAKGEWQYFVVVGLADLSSPSMLHPRSEPGEPEIFDCVLPDGEGESGMDGGLRPLVVGGRV